MLDENASELGFEVAHAVVFFGAAGPHHVVAVESVVGCIADGCVVGHDGRVEVVLFAVQSAAVPSVAHTLAKHEYELSANDFALRIENIEIACKGEVGQMFEKAIGWQRLMYLLVVQVGQYVVEGWQVGVVAADDGLGLCGTAYASASIFVNAFVNLNRVGGVNVEVVMCLVAESACFKSLLPARVVV